MQNVPFFAFLLGSWECLMFFVWSIPWCCVINSWNCGSSDLQLFDLTFEACDSWCPRHVLTKMALNKSIGKHGERSWARNGMEVLMVASMTWLILEDVNTSATAFQRLDSKGIARNDMRHLYWRTFSRKFEVFLVLLAVQKETYHISFFKSSKLKNQNGTRSHG